MGSDSIITLECVPGTRTEGDVVSGFVTVNPALALEKDVETVRVALKAEMHTWITVSTGQSTTVHRQKDILLDIEEVLWTRNTSSPTQSPTRIPFSITIPATTYNQKRLPPSFHCGSSHTGGRVQYYIHAVAMRKSWYQRNQRQNFAFPFLPLDYTPAPFFQFVDWPGPWATSRASEEMRSNLLKLFSAPAQVDCLFEMPHIDAFPLFKPVPVRFTVTCQSHIMPSSNQSDPSTFDFPRVPKLSDVDLSVIITTQIHVRSMKRNLVDDLGLVAGFGLPKDNHLRSQWGSGVKTEVSAPQWVADNHKADKGRWVETVTFHSTIVFRCPPPIQSQMINSKVNLDIKVKFPGLGHNVKMAVSQLPVTSGLSAQQRAAVMQGSSQQALPGGELPVYPGQERPQLDMPPSYWDVVDVDEKGGADSKEK